MAANNDEINTPSGEESVIIDVGTLDLKNKVSISATGVNIEQLEKAESIIANMADSYLDWAMEDIARLQSAYVRLMQDIDHYDIHLKEIFEISHDMKGQGGSFNYHLMTEIGNYLCRFVERIKSQPTPKLLDIIKLHIDAMRMVLVGKIKGRGGEKGQKIIDGLEATLQKYIPDVVENVSALHRQQLKESAESEPEPEA